MTLHTSRNTILKGIGLLAGALVAAPMLVACQAEPAPDPEPGQTTVDAVSFGVLRAPTGALAVVTGEQDWYSDAGVEVEFNSFAEGGGPAIIQAMAGGTPDIALLNLATTVLALGQGTFDVQIVSVAANPSRALPLLATKDIKSVEDLRGKRVSAPQGGGQYYLLASILDKHGMTFDDIDYKPLPVGEAQAAFITGQLDAVISSANGTVLIQENAPGTHVLFDGTDFDEEDAYSSPDVIIATRDAVENNPEGIARFLTAYHESGIAFLTDSATRAEAIDAIKNYMESVGAGVDDIESTEASVDAIDFYNLEESRALLASDGFMDAINKQVDFWLAAGVFTSAPDLSGAVNASIIAE
jgi:NitT/TauT family transport system substrate-binding protein